MEQIVDRINVWSLKIVIKKFKMLLSLLFMCIKSVKNITFGILVGQYR